VIQLIIYGVLAALVAGTLYAGYQHVVDKGRNEIKTKYAELIDKCDKLSDGRDSGRSPAMCAKEWTAAMDANATLQVDLANLDTQRQACTDSIKGWKTLADRASAVADQNRKTAEGAINQLRGSRDSSLAKSRLTPTASESCEQILDELDRDSRDLAEKRAILFPNEKAAPPADRVRIGK
jgi:outer membrane murein-binding lipoprotein Lpp